MFGNDGQAAAEGQLQVDGQCAVCGGVGVFATPRDSKFAARSFPCPSCGAVVRFRSEATAIIDEFGRGRHLALASLVVDADFAGIAIYNTGIAGPIRTALQTLPDYVESTFLDGATPGEVRDGVRHEDLQALSFADARFDLVTSSHVMEHVADPRRAFSELYRVLRPGGRLIFSIPVPWPPMQTSVTRATLVDGAIEHVRPPVYHESPGGEPSLVFTDFGTDLLDLLADLGFVARQQRPHMGVELACRDSVFVAIKPA